MIHECDCGEKYTQIEYLYQCQARNHGLKLPTKPTRALRMEAALLRVKGWLIRMAMKNEEDAKKCSYLSLRDAYLADAKNYRAIIEDIEKALERHP